MDFSSTHLVYRFFLKQTLHIFCLCTFCCRLKLYFKLAMAMETSVFYAKDQL